MECPEEESPPAQGSPGVSQLRDDPQAPGEGHNPSGVSVTPQFGGPVLYLRAVPTVSPHSASEGGQLPNALRAAPAAPRIPSGFVPAREAGGSRRWVSRFAAPRPPGPPALTGAGPGAHGGTGPAHTARPRPPRMRRAHALPRPRPPPLAPPTARTPPTPRAPPTALCLQCACAKGHGARVRAAAVCRQRATHARGRELGMGALRGYWEHWGIVGIPRRMGILGPGELWGYWEHCGDTGDTRGMGVLGPRAL